MRNAPRGGHGVVPARLAEGTRLGIAPLARGLARAGVTANMVTIFGVALTVAGGALIAADRPLPALVALLVGTASDTLDGAIARATGGGTRVGAFLDSTADRLADAAIFGGTAALGFALGFGLLFWAGLVALVASALVPYVRAKAESLGVSATVGPAPREARVVILLLGLAAWALFGENELYLVAVLVVAALSLITFVQRVVVTARALRQTKEGT
jgi:CDP-diacylglycerol--glycerol-3-phosphate 3-phosphatidyltransferase